MSDKRREFDALMRKGLSLHQGGRLNEALALYQHAIALDPGHADAHKFRGMALGRLGRYDDAQASYARALAIDPDDAGTHYNQSNLARDRGELARALDGYDRAIALKPDLVEAHNNRSDLLIRMSRFEEAIAATDRLIRLSPGFVAAHNNRGNALKELGRFEAAIASYDRAIALAPEFAEAHYNRGTALHEIKRFDEAIASYDRAIALNRDHVFAHFNRSFVKLLQAKFEEGLVEYEWRRATHQLPAAHLLDKPQWLGREDLAGKTILIYFEIGLGDTIHLARYIRDLNERGARVLFAPQRQLRALMQSLDGEFEIVDPADRSLAFDFQCPMLSLPLALGTTAATIPDRVPYLRADPMRTAFWRERIGQHGFRVGVCWQGSTNKVDAGRSFPLASLREIALLPGVRLISLHKGAGEKQLAALPEGMAVELPGADFDAGPDAFIDTAAVMENCDLVITSDTSVAHLAGALARPNWLALKYVADWRWLLDRSDSPWYPTMTLFRQPAPGDWTGVFREMEDALRRRLPA